MKTKLALIFLTAITLFSASVFSGQLSEVTYIAAIRPYVGTNTIFINTSTAAICGANSFTIDLSKANGKAAYAATLAAMMANKKVQLEITESKGCGAGQFVELQSITVFAQ